MLRGCFRRGGDGETGVADHLLPKHGSVTGASRLRSKLFGPATTNGRFALIPCKSGSGSAGL